MDTKLRDALREAMKQAVDYDGLDLSKTGPAHWYRIAERALAAPPAAPNKCKWPACECVLDPKNCATQPKGKT